VTFTILSTGFAAPAGPCTPKSVGKNVGKGSQRVPNRCVSESEVDADIFAHLLADRLAKIVPDGFHVEAVDGML